MFSIKHNNFAYNSNLKIDPTPVGGIYNLYFTSDEGKPNLFVAQINSSG